MSQKANQLHRRMHLSPADRGGGNYDVKSGPRGEFQTDSKLSP